MKSLIWTFIAFAVLSCGTNSSDSTSASSATGNTRAVIKNGSTTIAHVVAWTYVGGVVGVYIPSVDKYAVIDLTTGLYRGVGVSEAATFYYTVDSCANTPLVVKNGFIGEVGKTTLSMRGTPRKYVTLLKPHSPTILQPLLRLPLVTNELAKNRDLIF